MESRNSAAPVVPAEAARTLLLAGQGLLADPARRAGPRAVQRAVEQLGFVQVDTINVVERAHHHILQSRLDGYRPDHLTRLLERDRSLFEHWTHDASVIRADWFPFWRHRFDRFRTSRRAEAWIRRRMGDDHERLVRHVWRRVTREGPLMSRDFDDGGGGTPGGWWNWKPSRAALELLWRVGRLSIAGRRNFHKIYDRTDRVHPEAAGRPRPPVSIHREWACREAMERLGVATPIELVRYLEAVDLASARSWCRSAAHRGEIVPVRVTPADGSAPQEAFAVPDWERRAARAPTAPDRLRPLSPFDPVIHDRARTLRRFGFDYRIECFVPAAKRRHGYYVMPLLEGDRFVGRFDPKLERERGVLRIRQLWWEPHVRPTKARLRALEKALDLFAHQVGAERFELPV